MNNTNMDQTLSIMESKHTFDYMNTYYSSKLEEQKTMYDLTGDIQMLDNMAYLVGKFRTLVTKNNQSKIEKSKVNNPSNTSSNQGQPVTK